MSPDRTTIIHSGVLFKRGYGSAPLLRRKSWKPRYFVLTSTTLQYYTFENGKLLEEINLLDSTEEGLEIMPADARKTGRSASTIWRLALNMLEGRRLLVAALTEREMNTWILHLTRVLRAIDANVQEWAPIQQPTPTIQQPTEELALESHQQELAASWKSATTDFANFVSQPRRSAIFRRNSTETLSTMPSFQRHSTGQLDDPAVERPGVRKVTFESEDAGREEAAEPVEDDFNADALRNALREFTAATSRADEDDDYDVTVQYMKVGADGELEPFQPQDKVATPVEHDDYDVTVHYMKVGADGELVPLEPQDEVVTPAEHPSVDTELPRRRKWTFGKTHRHSTGSFATEIDGNFIQNLLQALALRPSSSSASTQTSTASLVSSTRSSLSANDTDDHAIGKWINRLKTKWRDHREEADSRRSHTRNPRDSTSWLRVSSLTELVGSTKTTVRMRRDSDVAAAHPPGE